MLLKALGGLELEGTAFTRAKPLLLLAYLTLEGARERRFVAELFWPGASDKLNSLSRALSQLRKGAAGSVEADEHRVWSTVGSDVETFLERVAAKDYRAALEHYRGPFLEATTLSDWGVEVEEWVYEKRERLAGRAQEAYLALAEEAASRGRFHEAADHAESAFRLEGAPVPEPESLLRYFALLQAGENPLAARVREEADGYGIALRLSPAEARSRLRSTFLGRERERARLEGLRPGQWAWLRGGAGMGKTTLLRSLPGTYLQGRAGLPYATLEPVLGGALEEGEEAMLRRLSGATGSWLVDGWTWMDPESQKLLRQLRDLRPDVSVTIASREDAPFRVDVELELVPLSAEELAGQPGLFEATGGLPALVGARLRGEPLEAALETRLHALSATAADIYLALVLLEQPEPTLVRRGLDLEAAAMVAALEELVAAGLTDQGGAPRAAQAAREYLEGRPLVASRLALGVARELAGADAFPHYSRARLLWEDGDLPAVEASYLAWGAELLRRGFAQRAAEVLTEAPGSEAVLFLRARSLERAGVYKEALKLLEGVAESPKVMALRGALLWRLGRPAEAQRAAEGALEGEPEARAEALNTLGNLERSAGNFREAAALARRAAAVWQSLGQRTRWSGALNNYAIALTLAGEEAEGAFHEALEVAGDNPLLRARVFLSLGWMHERLQRPDAARESYRQAADLAEGVGATDSAAYAWNNIGVLDHRERRPEAARAAYERALDLARQAGELRMIGMFMANLAELTNNVDAWKEALRILEEAGHGDEAEQYRADLPADHPFRNHAGNGV